MFFPLVLSVGEGGIEPELVAEDPNDSLHHLLTRVGGYFPSVVEVVEVFELVFVLTYLVCKGL